MCGRRRQQGQLAFAVQPRQRGCCGSRRQSRLLEATKAQYPESSFLHPAPDAYQPKTMAGLIAVGIGLGAEKLGRKISEKRLEKKEKKSAAVC